MGTPTPCGAQPGRMCPIAPAPVSAPRRSSRRPPRLRPAHAIRVLPIPRASTPALIGLICVLCRGCASAGEVATSPSTGTSSSVAASRSASASATSVDRPAVPGPTDKVSVSRVELLRERLELLDGFLEHQANDHYNHYPEALGVHEGGIPAAVWPTSPWTGRPMASGKSTGDFTYKVDRRAGTFSIIVHFSNGAHARSVDRSARRLASASGASHCGERRRPNACMNGMTGV